MSNHRIDAPLLCEAVFTKAKQEGTSRASFTCIQSNETSVRVRDGMLENFEQKRPRNTAVVSVWFGEKTASVTGTDMKTDAVLNLVTHACAIANVSTDDPYTMIAPPELWADDLETLIPLLQLEDTETPPEADELKRWAKDMEHAALQTPGVTKLEDNEVASARRDITSATSTGFYSSQKETQYSAVIQVIAGSGTNMTGDYDMSVSRFRKGLRPMAEIGRRAGERAVLRQNPRSLKTQKIPVIFDERVSRALLSCFFAAIGGNTIYEKASFLKEMMGKQVFPKTITITDDPHIPGGLGTRAYDSEFVKTRRLDFIQEGVLTSWALSLRSAKKLGLNTTGHAGGFSNLFMRNGTTEREQLLRAQKHALLVTEMMGQNPNISSGDFSSGVGGFFIENGAIVHPVKDVTIGGNLLDIFRNLTPADDLRFEQEINAPTILVEGMTVAGR